MTKPSHPIIKSLGADAIRERIGVTDHSVRHAKSSGTFPASWYAPLLEMCAEKGVACPLDAFNWRSPSNQASESAEGV